jgi:hypothetical protein
MAQRGRPPKPLEQKKLLGNPGKRALPEEAELQQLPRVNGIPDPPRPLLNPGRELWERSWSLGADWISPDFDVELLLMTCEMVDERWNLRIKAMNNDDLAMGRRVDRLAGLIRENLSLLGFTPVDRTRLGVARVKARSKLEDLIARANTHGSVATEVADAGAEASPGAIEG